MFWILLKLMDNKGCNKYNCYHIKHTLLSIINAYTMIKQDHTILWVDHMEALGRSRINSIMCVCCVNRYLEWAI